MTDLTPFAELVPLDHGLSVAVFVAPTRIYSNPR